MDAELLLWIYAVGLLILGFVLILLEIFVIPGLNIFGIAGMGTVCVGIYFAYIKLGPSAAIVTGLLGVSGTAALVWSLVRNRAWQRMVLTAETDSASGFNSAPAELSAFASRVGVATTPLHPTGRAQFGEETVDVVTEGGFVDSGAQVEVIAVVGTRIVVQQRGDEADNFDHRE